jgi:hypothetical protein
MLYVLSQSAERMALGGVGLLSKQASTPTPSRIRNAPTAWARLTDSPSQRYETIRTLTISKWEAANATPTGTCLRRRIHVANAPK